MTHTPLSEQEMALLRGHLESSERHLHAAQKLLEQYAPEPLEPSEEQLPPARPTQRGNASRVALGSAKGQEVYGNFDGQGMIDSEGRQYPVPANYASKSKLIEGQDMKLTITAEGKFVYKQIGMIDHYSAVGPLLYEHGQYSVLVEGQKYRILLASVTFYRAKTGDEVTILLPEGQSAQWGAVDNILPSLNEAGQKEAKKMAEEGTQ